MSHDMTTKSSWTSELGQFRIVSLLEGVSYLLLLGVAMPMKYWMGDPTLVRVLGRVHGGLFVLFAVTLLRVAVEDGWPWRKSLTAFLASLAPLGAFWFDRKLRGEGAPRTG
jgi:integral membrane protein